MAKYVKLKDVLRIRRELLCLGTDSGFGLRYGSNDCQCKGCEAYRVLMCEIKKLKRRKR